MFLAGKVVLATQLSENFTDTNQLAGKRLGRLGRSARYIDFP